MIGAKWVRAEGNELWAWGELNHKQNGKQIISFRGSSSVFVGWCAYAFIVEFKEALINKSPKT